MNKAEILQALKSTREINNFSRTRNWKEAFNLHRESTGAKLSLNCNKCFQQVKEWLEN